MIGREAFHAAGVNFPDSLIIENKYQIKPPLPFISGGELAGVVDAVGPGLTRFAPGRKVARRGRRHRHRGDRDRRGARRASSPQHLHRKSCAPVANTAPTRWIDYERDDLRELIKALTAGRGVDVVLDPVGGRYAETALRSTGWGGRYLVIGFAAGDIPKIAMNLVLLKGSALVGVFWGDFLKREPAQGEHDVQELFALYRKAVSGHWCRRATRWLPPA